YPVISEYGYTYEPGRWDHCPSGFAFTQGNDGGVNGTGVLQPGDILCAFKRYVESPVTLTIKDGYVVSMSGSGVDARLIDSYIKSFDDERAYAISHIGWGLNEKARWYQFAVTRQLPTEHVMNALSFYGNVLFSLGPNLEVGGTNDTACHLDLPMRECSLWLDGTQILEKGEVIHPAMRVERHAWARPASRPPTTGPPAPSAPARRAGDSAARTPVPQWQRYPVRGRRGSR